MIFSFTSLSGSYGLLIAHYIYISNNPWSWKIILPLTILIVATTSVVIHFMEMDMLDRNRYVAFFGYMLQGLVLV